MISTPMLSVVSITYNHEPFIAKMIEGVLLQQTTFPIELIIAEDCSTDRTREIITSYVQQYPELIRVITSNDNVGAVANERRAMFQARGKYIALCEGDDCWTDPLKLQKQVDFLESNPEYSVCFHRCRNYVIESGVESEDQCGFLFQNEDIQAVEVTIEMFFNRWITMPLTMVYRKAAFDMDISLKYKHYRDMHLIYHLLQAGKGYLFGFFGGVRNVHEGGMASMIPLLCQSKTSIQISMELYKINRTEETKVFYCNVLQWSGYQNLKTFGNRTSAFFQFLRLFLLNWNLKQLLSNLKKFMN